MAHVIIFTDGSARGNPGNGGWGAVCVYPKSSGELRVDELGGASAYTTNNQMELTAAIEGLKNFNNFYNDNKLNTTNDAESVFYTIYTDSAYVINGITKWVYGWQQNGWITSTKQEVSNRDLWEALLEQISNKEVDWKYVGGHIGIAGNERCDQIATEFADTILKGEADLALIQLYKGSLVGYPIKVLNTETGELILDEDGGSKSGGSAEKKAKAKERSKIAAYSYVSMVNGKIETHKTWAECEKRVKGVKGTRFKKAISKNDEDEIKKDFSSNN